MLNFSLDADDTALDTTSGVVTATHSALNRSYLSSWARSINNNDTHFNLDALLFEEDIMDTENSYQHQQMCHIRNDSENGALERIYGMNNLTTLNETSTCHGSATPGTVCVSRMTVLYTLSVFFNT